jgi:hypothetical protein
MHRPLLIAVFALLLASVPLSAQHGGGHASGGGHGGMASHGGFSSGHSSSHASSGHAFSGTHSGSGFGAHSFSGPASRSFSSRAFNHSGGVRIGTYGFRNNCYGYVCRYGNPGGYAGFYDPYWWSNSGSSFDYDQQYQTGLANQMNAQSLDEQRMRQQQDQNAYAQSAPPPRERSEHAEINEAAPVTVLVFRDEHKQEVHNYAIVGQTLWNFNPQHTQKIPLSDLDIPATTKANDERGVDFRVPGAGDGQ